MKVPLREGDSAKILNIFKQDYNVCLFLNWRFVSLFYKNSFVV